MKPTEETIKQWKKEFEDYVSRVRLEKGNTGFSMPLKDLGIYPLTAYLAAKESSQTEIDGNELFNGRVWVSKIEELRQKAADLNYQLNILKSENCQLRVDLKYATDLLILSEKLISGKMSEFEFAQKTTLLLENKLAKERSE